MKNESSVKLLNSNRIRIVYVGILGEGRFIEEIIKFVLSNPEFEFHIGGFGSLELEIKNISSKHDNIIFYGKLQYDKTLELESSCDIMVAIYDPGVKNHIYAAPK